MAAPDDATFEQWVREIIFNPDAPVNDPAVIDSGWLQRLREIYERDGPVPKAGAARMAMTQTGCAGQ
jgi:hypothetical protein